MRIYIFAGARPRPPLCWPQAHACSMRKLIKAPGAPYADLTVTVAAKPDDIAGPPVRFFFS
jgi:hypothetical protein